VVDMDITKFFDHVNHDLLMTRIGQTIRDRRVLRLMGRYLRAGVMIGGVVQASEEGTPQGGPLSPLLANLYLDALDRELARRGLAFCRYADDCNIYVPASRLGSGNTCGWKSTRPRVEWGGLGNGSSLGLRSTRKGRSKWPPRVWTGSSRKSGNYGEAARVGAVVNCATGGALTCKAGGPTMAWPSTAGMSWDWKAGYGATFGAAFGSGGTTGGAGGGSYADWD
jgi:hypothetical protein